MFARMLHVALFAVVGLALIAPANADDLLDSVVRDTKRRQFWPRPFTEMDRDAARAPFVAMVSNGWQRQNMIGDHCFNSEDGGNLTSAAKLKIEWILYESPEQHRAIFVHRGKTPQETGNRVEMVRKYAAEIADDSHTAPVMPTDMADRGSPASRVDLVTRKFQAAMPDPKLPTPQAMGGTSN